MLYSHNQENEKLKQFTIFLSHAVKGDRQYATVVKITYCLKRTNMLLVAKRCITSPGICCTLYSFYRKLIKITFAT